MTQGRPPDGREPMLRRSSRQQESAAQDIPTQRFTRSGIPLKAHYGAGDAATGGAGEAPGEFPYTRGRKPGSQSAGGWIQRELSGEGGPAESNAQIKYLLGKGQTGIDVIGDSPTMAMLDPDHPLAIHAVGTQGVSLARKQDYLDLFAGIPLDRISVSNSVPALFSMTGLYLAAGAQGVSPDRLRGSVLQPPLFAEDCGYAMHMPHALQARIAADVMQFCAEAMPRFHACIEDTYFFSESGLNAVEEMALGFVEIRCLTRILITRGVNVDRFAPRIAILVNCGMDLFEEIAKIRATRRLFARMMKEEFGARDPRSLSVVVSSHTSGLTLTAQQPVNNVVRGAIQGMALALAGVQAMEISTFDEGYRTPSREAHLVALRTQQILDLETGVTRVADPLGGSYYVEALTDELERRIRTLVSEIEAAGDPLELADRGYFRKFFTDAMERHQRGIALGKDQVVGVNVHCIPEDEDTMLRDMAERKIAPARWRAEQIAAHKRERGIEPVRAALRRVKADAAAPGTNIVPAVLEATDADATMGEIAGALRLACGKAWDPFGMVEPLIR